MFVFSWALGPGHQNPSRNSENTRIPLDGLKALECGLRDRTCTVTGAVSAMLPGQYSCSNCSRTPCLALSISLMSSEDTLL